MNGLLDFDGTSVGDRFFHAGRIDSLCPGRTCNANGGDYGHQSYRQPLLSTMGHFHGLLPWLIFRFTGRGGAYVGRISLVPPLSRDGTKTPDAMRRYNNGTGAVGGRCRPAWALHQSVWIGLRTPLWR